ncbi:MAG TPA: hypothetical protein VGN05_16380 [Parvibaculum sp.]|jgi:hypothetical protein
MRMTAAILGLAASMAFAPAAFAGTPQSIDPTTGDPVLPDYQTQQSNSTTVETRDVGAYPQPAQSSTMQTTVTTERKTTGATNYGSMNNAPATHEEPKSIGQAGHQIGQDAGKAGKTVGSTTRDVTTTIGHGVRDTTKAIGHGTRDFFRGIGNGWSQAGD